MKGQNDSTIAIKQRHTESIILQLQDDHPPPQHSNQLNPYLEPISTQNVPLKLQPKPLHPCFLISNLICNICPILLAYLQLKGQGLALIIMIPVTVSAYFVYLVCAYHFSNLLPLVQMASLQEYKANFEKLTRAKCWLRFKYVSSRRMIDEEAKIFHQDYPNITVVDRSGSFYEVDQEYSVVFVRYRKKYFFCDNMFKAQVHTDFNEFVDKHRKEHDSPDGRAPLRSKETIEFAIEGMASEVGYCLYENNCYRGIFYLMLVAGVAAYFEKCMECRVLRYQVDIVKEVCPQRQN